MLSMKDLSVFILSYVKSVGFDLNSTIISLYNDNVLDDILKNGYVDNKEKSIKGFFINDLLIDLKKENQSIFKKYLDLMDNPFIVFTDSSKLKKLEINKDIEKVFLVENLQKDDFVLGLASVNISNMTTGALTNISNGIKDSGKRYPRFYFTMTNFCNRSCPFCCCSSSPQKKTFLPFEKFVELLNTEDEYEVQFEGGEPLVHPEFYKMAEYCLNDERCKLIILCTNSVLIPFNNEEKLIKWLSLFKNKPFILKPSYNSYLIKKDKNLLNKLIMIKNVWNKIDWQVGSNFIINVRRDQLAKDKESWINDDMKTSGLISNANIFFYQKMGFAKDEEYIEPVTIQNGMRFYLIAPDGTNWNTGLAERAKYMEDME